MKASPAITPASTSRRSSGLKRSRSAQTRNPQASPIGSISAAAVYLKAVAKPSPAPAIA